jgi:hypothetical protein
MKKLWSLETQVNLIFTLRHAHLCFLRAILDNLGVRKFFILEWGVPLKSKGYSLNSILPQSKKFWSSETQINLIFALRHAHLYFLCGNLCDNRIKKIFNWALWIPWEILGKTIDANEKTLILRNSDKPYNCVEACLSLLPECNSW